ncbi:glycosyltransferase involved in cell wall biogenesis [Mycobacterium sp. GA-1841]|nr:glycosyltransferase involved in cell wall biogenesis [Mycobacterium sp. GA-1841]
MTIPVAVLVVAKAPVAGLAKTRLAAAVGADAAAAIAAAALLDTLDAVVAAPVQARVVALTGDLDRAHSSREIRARLAGFTVVVQRGDAFAERLANAHTDAAAATGLPVLQIGMDTPEVTARLIEECADVLATSDAVLGMAADGGWWLLGVRDPVTAQCLVKVPMSQPDTGALTHAALCGTGVSVHQVCAMPDVDTVADVDAVRRMCAPDSRFAHATLAAGV